MGGRVWCHFAVCEKAPHITRAPATTHCNNAPRQPQNPHRLDAIGAIGIARCFTFGGRFNRPLYDPDQKARPAEALTREQYMQLHADAVAASAAGGDEGEGGDGGGGGGGAASKTAKKQQPASINHFHEKLLTLKGRMKTEAGRKLAEGRHAFMEGYLRQFDLELQGKA